jgi:hypothetical protein
MQRQKAKYYHSDEHFVVLEVLKKNDDGTLDLCNAQGRLVVGRCPVAEDGQRVTSSTAILIDEEKKEEKKEKDAEPEKGKGKK